MALELFLAVSKWAMITLADSWIRDITGSLSVPALHQYISLWSCFQHIHLDPSLPVKFIWKWSVNQKYSLASAYEAFFLGQCGVLLAEDKGAG
jgi:hypothetical protein